MKFSHFCSLLVLIDFFLVTACQRERSLSEDHRYNNTVGSGARTSRRLSDEEEIAALQAWLDNQVKNKNQIVGLSAFIVGGKGPIHKVYSGQAVLESAWDARKKQGVTNEAQVVSEETSCMLASTSKPFTWTALSILLDAKKFDLDDSIEDVLSFQVRNPSFQTTPITYRHLYTHTMGLKGRYNSSINSWFLDFCSRLHSYH